MSVSQDKVIAVVQPHRFTRLRDLFDDFCTCFNDADIVLVAPTSHAAGEQKLEGVRRATRWPKGCAIAVTAASPEAVGVPTALAGMVVRELASPGDCVVCLGAGSISQWANALPAQLAGLGDCR